MNPKHRETMPLSGEEIVDRYFKCMDAKDLPGMLELFDYDAVIYEPFSKENSLYGKSAIEAFLNVAMMANSDLRRRMKIEKPSKTDDSHNNSIIALVTFEKGNHLRIRFTFKFADNEKVGEKKIKSLHIEFI